jgi:hypothetical protein
VIGNANPVPEISNQVVFLWGFFRIINDTAWKGLSWMTIRYQDKNRKEGSIHLLDTFGLLMGKKSGNPHT